jgi:hypothetical protein
MDEHLQQSLIAKTLALGQFPRLGEIGLWQANRDLHTALPIHPGDQTRSPDLASRSLSGSRALFHVFFSRPSSLSLMNLGISDVFRFILRSFPLRSPCVIIASLPGVEVVRRYYAQPFATFCRDHGQKAASIALAVIHESKLFFNILLIDGNGIVQQRLLRFFV